LALCLLNKYTSIHTDKPSAKIHFVPEKNLLSAEHQLGKVDENYAKEFVQ